jgi:VCBS repeat-containing protein
VSLSDVDTSKAGVYDYTVTCPGTCPGAGATGHVTVEVCNECPIAEDDDWSTCNYLQVNSPGVLVNDHDSDGDALTAVLVSGPSHGTLTFNADGSFTYDYTDNPGLFDTDTFTYKAYDGECYSEEATVTITILPPCEADVPDVCVCYGTTKDEILSEISAVADCGLCGEIPQITTDITADIPAAGDYSYTVTCAGDCPDQATGTVHVKANDVCGMDGVVFTGPIYIGQALTSATVAVEIVGDEIWATFDMGDSGYTLDTTHLYVGTSPSPDCTPGQFPYQDANLECASSHIMKVPAPGDLDCGDTLYVAAHIATCDGQTGWGSYGGCTIDCNRWNYCMSGIVSCECTCDCSA